MRPRPKEKTMSKTNNSNPANLTKLERFIEEKIFRLPPR